MEAYCVKCKAKSEMNSPKMTQTSKGGYMAKGQCKTCGTTMCRICSKDNALKMVDLGEVEKAF